MVLEPGSGESQFVGVRGENLGAFVTVIIRTLVVNHDEENVGLLAENPRNLDRNTEKSCEKLHLDLDDLDQ